MLELLKFINKLSYTRMIVTCTIVLVLLSTPYLPDILDTVKSYIKGGEVSSIKKLTQDEVEFIDKKSLNLIGDHPSVHNLIIYKFVPTGDEYKYQGSQYVTSYGRSKGYPSKYDEEGIPSSRTWIPLSSYRFLHIPVLKGSRRISRVEDIVRILATPDHPNYKDYLGEIDLLTLQDSNIVEVYVEPIIRRDVPVGFIVVMTTDDVSESIIQDTSMLSLRLREVISHD